MRKEKVKRKTKETEIEIELNIDGRGESSIKTGIPFFDHLLKSFAKHGLFDLFVDASGDVEVDDHHTVEDTGIVLGETFRRCLREGKNISRFGDAIVPMDESLSMCAVDVDGRGFFVFSGKFERGKIGNLSMENVPHFLRSFASSAGITINIKVEGENDHHKAEAIFKSLGIALEKATRIDERRGIPSTKY